MRESVPETDERVAFLAPLGFGNADVVVAVPRAWIDVRSMADLEDVAATFHARRGRRMRVATKYVNLTRRFFAERGVTDYRIVESLGATEGRTRGGRRGTHRRYHDHGRDPRGQCPQGARRRGDATVGGQSRRIPEGELERAAARDGTRHPGPNRGRRAGPYVSRGTGALPRRRARSRAGRPRNVRRPSCSAATQVGSC